jgi:hypothetical protein
MKNQKTILLLIILLISFKSFAQSNNGIANESVEIVRWINNFEDNNSPERIMEGTLRDKVHVEYNQGVLIIYSMALQGYREPIMIVREIFNIKDVIRIEAQESNINEYVIVDISIQVKEGSIRMECKNDNQIEFSRCGIENKWFDKVGFCSKNLRFKFPKEFAQQRIERVYKALNELVVINGGNPKIGPKF